MADKGGGDKTEKPTRKRLEDARKKGDIAKSKDLSATIGLLAWGVILLFGAGFAGRQLIALFDASFTGIAQADRFTSAAGVVGGAAFAAFVLITALALIPPAMAGLVVEFLQAGPVFTTEKMKPSLDKMNPLEGIKRMFSLDNLVELLKTIAKAALILFIAWILLKAELPDIIGRAAIGELPATSGEGRARAAELLAQTGDIARMMLLWVLGAFLLVAVLDSAYQRHAYAKKLRMSLRDIRDEAKESEGDPHIKSNRRQFHQEWASQNAVGAARDASVLVLNPTHLALALAYDPETCPVPVLTAKGEGPLARAMREAAEQAGVPTIRNVEVARALFDKAEVDAVVPRDMFDAIAEIIIWAERVRNGAGPTPERDEEA